MLPRDDIGYANGGRPGIALEEQIRVLPMIGQNRSVEA
jgi:hypothetical protein